MKRGYDIGHDDLDLSIHTAEAFLPTTHMVIARSELARLTNTAHAAGVAEQAKRTWPDIQRAFYNGRARGLEIALRFRLHWWVCAAIAFIGFTAGRLSGI